MSDMKNKKIFYEDLVAEKVIEAIEAGTAPWLKPWSGEELYQNYPRNGLTGKEYNGINNINLSVSGFQDPRWYTFKQAQKLDAKVKKGAKAIMIEHWRFKELVQEMDENNNPIFGEDGKPKKIEVRLKNPKASYAYVFNAEQIDGLPPLEKRELPVRNFTPNIIAEEILKNSGADINHVGGGRASYAPRTDSITLPLKEQFETIEGYYGTALHELGHWTGHESRLNRDLSGRFGTESYAREELRAELASFMLSSKIGIDFDPSQHYSYIGSWVKILTEEKQEIFKASRDAKKISDYIEGLSMEKTNQKMYNNDGTLTMEEAIKRIDINLGDASFGNPVYLKDGTVIMEHLTGGTVDGVKSEGLFLFAGEPGKMKPFKSLSFAEAKALVADTYSEQIKQEIDPKKMETSGAFLDSPYYYDEIRNEINSYLKEMKVTLNQDLIKEYEAAVVGMIESDGGYTIAEAVKEAYFDVNEKIHIEQGKTDWQNNSYNPPVNEADRGSYNHGWHESNKQVNTKFVLFDPITLKNVATADTLEDLKQEYLALTKNEFFKDMDTLVYEMKQEANGTWTANYDKKLDVDWNNFEKSISQSTLKQTYLYVPIDEKEAAKSVGCRWDAENKAWYAPKGTELQKISAWTLNNQQIKIGAFVDGGAMDTDPIVAFREELAKRGFELPGNPIADGNFHRVKVPGDKGSTKSGSYRIHNDGRPNLYLKDFKNGIEESISHKESYFRAGADDKTIEAQKEINRIKSLQAQKDLERKHYAISKRLQETIPKLDTAPLDNFYLVKKGIETTEGVKVDDNGSLVIPFIDNEGNIKTIQKIIEKDDGSYFKLFEEGGQKVGNFAYIGNDFMPNLAKDNQTFIICEGWATGASLREATGIPVLVAGDAGNIKNVLQNVITDNNTLNIIIAADNDLNNVGINKADDAINSLEEIMPAMKPKVVSVKPSFTAQEIENKLTDFNDLARSRGKAAVLSQINVAITKLEKLEQKQELKEEKAIDQEHKKQQDTARDHTLGMAINS